MLVSPGKCANYCLHVYVLILLFSTSLVSSGILYPRESETREVKSLDGVWDFYISPEISENAVPEGLDEQLYKMGLPRESVLPMPVPASYNDITVDPKLRDHVGVVWYERKFFVPRSWQDQGRRVFLRFGSVHYNATVWVNGYEAMQHDIGHLPFEGEVTPWLDFGLLNRVTVAVDNQLSPFTVPQGDVRTLDIGDGKTKIVSTYTFDFFNYAGIHRPVLLYATPAVYVDDVTVSSTISASPSGQGYDAAVSYLVSVAGDSAGSSSCQVSLVDASGVYQKRLQAGCEGVLLVTDANIWWPRYMDPEPGYMYTLEIELNIEGEVVDIYRQPIGIRTVHFNSSSILINGRQLYIRGVGRHEDSDIRGKGLDLPQLEKDANLLEWLGSNCYRTSHYPYSEESMDVADREGFLVIDEVPSVNTRFFSPELLENHRRAIKELIQRDKNRPSVFMWSIANEPLTEKPEAEPYFRDLRDLVQGLDHIQRPVTIALSTDAELDQVAHLLDVICFNRYNGWYTDAGQLEVIAFNVEKEANVWHNLFQKPVVVSEYGADTMPGIHVNPAFIWSEEYQTQLLAEHFKAFDKLRQQGFFIGEMIWNFADFQTDQGYTRVAGNKKGVFTRQRQPKSAAFHLRRRYWELAQEIDGISLPRETQLYVSSHTHSEL